MEQKTRAFTSCLVANCSSSMASLQKPQLRGERPSLILSREELYQSLKGLVFVIKVIIRETTQILHRSLLIIRFA